MNPYRTPGVRQAYDIDIEPMPIRCRPIVTQLRILAVVVLALPLAQAVPGCFEQPAQMAAAAGYEAQQMRCVEQYATKVDIDRCRAKVKLAWMVDAGQSADAGPRTLNVGFDNDGGRIADGSDQ